MAYKKPVAKPAAKPRAAAAAPKARTQAAARPPAARPPVQTKNYSRGRSVMDDKAITPAIREFQSRIKGTPKPSYTPAAPAAKPPKQVKPVFGMSGGGIEGAMRTGSSPTKPKGGYLNPRK